MHKPDNAFILKSLANPFDGPTVIVTYDDPPENIDVITVTGKVIVDSYRLDDVRTFGCHVSSKTTVAGLTPWLVD